MRSFGNDLARAALLLALLLSSLETSAQTAALKIVVIAGEDAVNVVQQKTAVAPIVEVRDRNDQPVSGAVVTFAIRSGRATLGGSRTLSITTNATGRAMASSLTPTGTGALKISATAAFQGQTATAVTIAQTNVMTAAQAAAAATAGTGGAGTAGTTAAGGAGGASSGGISATTLGIVGGAAAGGAIVATKALGGSGGTDYSGNFAGPIVVTGPPPFCGFTINMSGTLTITINDPSATTISGHASIEGTEALHYNAACALPDPAPERTAADTSLTGTKDNLSFTYQNQYTFTGPDGNRGSGMTTFNFTGAFDGTQITGVLTQTESNQSITGPPISGSGTTAFPVTLR